MDAMWNLTAILPPEKPPAGPDAPAVRLEAGAPHATAVAPPSFDALGFGRSFAPLAVVAHHDRVSGWSPLRVVARDAPLVPALAGALQYGLSIFEGLKAFRAPDGQAHFFRGDRHAARFRASAERLCLPLLDTSDFLTAAALAVRANEAWLPPYGRGGLYLRPALLGVDEVLGVRPASRCLFTVMASPAEALDDRPIRLWAESEFIRAAPGGLGAAKTGANYAAGLLGAERARGRGYDQVLWLDALERRFLAEGGTMNIFVVMDDRVVTPPLDGTILAGVTRDTCITLLRDLDIPVEERGIALDELQAAAAAGRLREVWCSGTAMRLGTVSEIGHRDGSIRPSGGDLGARVREQLTGLQDGRLPDPYGFRQKLDGG